MRHLPSAVGSASEDSSSATGVLHESFDYTGLPIQLCAGNSVRTSFLSSAVKFGGCPADLVR